MTQRSKPIRVAIIDRCVPVYRLGLYDALMADEELSCTIVAAAKPVERMGTVRFPGPDPMGSSRATSGRPWRWVDAPGVRVPGSRGRSVWQWGAVKAGSSRQFDAVIMMANPNDPSLWMCAILARLTRKRLIFWTHGLTRRDASLRRRMRVWWLRLAHAYLIYGHLGKAGMLSEGIDPAKCHVCYNSLDYSTQKALRETITEEQCRAIRGNLFGTRSELPLSISISRLNAPKRIDLLIRAHAALVRRGDECNLLIIGDGPERNRLEALVNDLDLQSSVRFYGECYDEVTLSTLIKSAAVAVTPGAIGLSVMHCLAYGVPCITHDDWFDQGPEFEAIVDGATGGFFHKDDLGDLARVMALWLNRSDERRQAVARACIAQIERFYTPQIQSSTFKRALKGLDANDLHIAWQESSQQ